jgi:hypothetical protein
MSAAFYRLALGLIFVQGVALSELSTAVRAQESEGATDSAELAKKLSNPIAALLTIPQQTDWDFGAGPTNGGVQLTIKTQPIVPIHLNAEWDIVSRTVFPFIDQHGIVPSYNSAGRYIGTSQSGLGDTLQAFFLTPVTLGPRDSLGRWAAVSHSDGDKL